MTFYLQPPTGFLSYQKMEMYALNRLKFMSRLMACKDDDEQLEVVIDAQAVQWSDCLIEGTVKDKISHYLLRLTLGNCPNTLEFFCRAETNLFCLRLKNFNENEWKQFFLSLDHVLHHQRHIEGGKMAGLVCLLDALKMKFGSLCAVARECAPTTGSTSTVDIPFQFLLNLVATRRVCLSQGVATLPLSKVIDVFAEHFHAILYSVTRRHQAAMKSVMADERMRRLDSVVKRAFMSEAYPLHGLPLRSVAVRLASLNEDFHLFPPCMAGPLTALQHFHRLHHNDRIQLTLFLKELGLPLHEALLFWKREYSQNTHPSYSGNCTHSWQGNERKYTYSIRHLYGLEGRRAQYSGHTCPSIQKKQSGCLEHGQCPFTSSDMESLSVFVSRQNVNMSGACMEKVRYLSRIKQFGKACSCFMSHKVRAIQDSTLETEKLKQCESCKEHASSANPDRVDFNVHEYSNVSWECNNKACDVSCVKCNKRRHMFEILASESKSYARFNGGCDTASVCDELKGILGCKRGGLKTCFCQSTFDRDKEEIFGPREINNRLMGNGHCLADDSNEDKDKGNVTCGNAIQKQRAHSCSLDLGCQSDSSKEEVRASIPKKRKFGELKSSQWISDSEDQIQDKFSKPSHYFWAFKSLVEGLKNCELTA